VSSADARTLLNIVSNCFAELRICAYELTEGKDLNWSPSLQMDEAASDEFEGVLSPSILVQLSEHVAMQVSVNLHWGAGEWMVDADIGQSDDRDDDSYRWLWRLPPLRSDNLDATLRALAQATSEVITAAKGLTLP
jgi:hypothetical protein